MISSNSKQLVFSSLRDSLVRQGVKSEFGNEITSRAVEDFTTDVDPFGFRGVEDRPVRVTVHAGSQIDNRDSTYDSVHFSYGGREYESYESPYENKMAYGLRVNHNGSWHNCDVVFAPDDNLG